MYLQRSNNYNQNSLFLMVLSYFQCHLAAVKNHQIYGLSSAVAIENKLFLAVFCQ
jgi:hypothetical protein